MSSRLKVKNRFSEKLVNKYTFDFIESDNIDDKVIFTINDSLYTTEGVKKNAGIESFEKYDFNNSEEPEAWRLELIREEDKSKRFELGDNPTTLIVLSQEKGENNEKIIFNGTNCKTLDQKLTTEEQISKEYQREELENSISKEQSMEMELMEIRLMEMYDNFQNIEIDKIKELDIHVSLLMNTEDPEKIQKITKDIEKTIKETPELRFSWVQHMQENLGIESRIKSAGIDSPILGQSMYAFITE